MNIHYRSTQIYTNIHKYARVNTTTTQIHKYTQIYTHYTTHQEEVAPQDGRG